MPLMAFIKIYWVLTCRKTDGCSNANSRYEHHHIPVQFITSSTFWFSWLL